MKPRHLVPFGLLEPAKPRHYREMLKVAWENRDEAAYAWRILKEGVCDGCSLGPKGLKDDVIDGTHLCLTRLRLLKLNTMGPMPDKAWEDGDALQRMSNKELHALGRVPYPLVKWGDEKGFHRITWDEALDLAASKLAHTMEEDPDRIGFFVTSRGLTNEPYYVTQKLARALGTNNVDLCARLCHAPSVNGLKDTIGWGAPTASLKDLIGADVVILWGTNVANNQPVTTKYLHEARKKGTRVIVVNCVREPGLERYWVPSNAGSAMFGTSLMDRFVQVNAGGDLALMNGVLKALDEKGLWREEWIAEHTTGFEELRDHVRRLPWDDLVEASGVPKEDIEAFAEEYGHADTAVLVYSMGLTQHTFGVQNVKGIVNLALARGNLGRERTGIIPIRGHSGVQGGGEVGVGPTSFPGGDAVNEENALKFSKQWGFDVPTQPGMMTGDMIEAAHRGDMDVLYSVGGNLLDTMPDPKFVHEAMAKVDLRIHQDIVLNTSMMFPAKEAVLVLPAATRYEQKGGGTSTNTERRVRFSPEIPGRRIGEALSEWEIPTRIAQRIPALAPYFPYHDDTVAIRQELEVAVPFYEGISRFSKAGDSIQWGGERLGTDGFTNMPDRKARFTVIDHPNTVIPQGMVQVSTRRGKQFNSIVLEERDAQFGKAGRKVVLMSEADVQHLGLEEGAGVRLVNDLGTFEGSVKVANIPRRHVQLYWPEANVLIPRRYDPVAGVPDYNAYARLEAL